MPHENSTTFFSSAALPRTTPRGPRMSTVVPDHVEDLDHVRVVELGDRARLAQAAFAHLLALVAAVAVTSLFATWCFRAYQQSI